MSLRRLFSAIAILLLAFASGCAAKKPTVSAGQISAFLATKPEALRPFFRPVIADRPQNRTLHLMRAGVAAMDLGERAIAKEVFDEVLGRIEVVYANDPDARKARSKWFDEGRKTFIGEPYERTMAYYYRGILHLQDGEYDTARACFRSGMLQDAFAEDKQNRCDFALMSFLDGWCSQRLGNLDKANEAYDEAELLLAARGGTETFKRPGPDDNILVVADTGEAPRKEAGGEGRRTLFYAQGAGTSDRIVTVNLTGQPVQLLAIEDIYRQATTRGGRAVDEVLGKKFRTKQRLDDGGSITMEVGKTIGLFAAYGVLWTTIIRSTGGGQNAQQAQLIAIIVLAGAVAIIAAGYGIKAISNKIRTKADAREWNNLPDFVHVGTFNVSKALLASLRATAVYTTLSGYPATGTRATSSLSPIVAPDGAAILWFRSRTALVPVVQD